MGLTLKLVKDDCRTYVNSIQRSFLTPEMLTMAINAARMEWADRIRYPEIRSLRPVADGATYIDVSSLVILDIVAVYYGSEEESNRIHAYDRGGKDVIKGATEVVEVSLGSESRPVGYFWDTAQGRFEFLLGTGSFTAPEATNVILRYHGLPSLYTTESDQDNQVMEIPTQYCYNIKHFVASYFYQSKDNYKAADQQYNRWNVALLRAEALLNKSKRDYPKQVKDGMHFAKQQYLNG